MSLNERWLTELVAEIDWPTQGDPLIEYLRSEMPVNITMTNWLAPGRESTQDSFSSNGHCLYSDLLPNRLVFGYSTDGIRVLVETEHQPAGLDALEPWASAFARASERLSRDEPEFRWWASIGARTENASGATKVIEGATLKGISICAADKPYTEGLDDPSHPTLGGANIISSFPLVASGKHRGYNWEVAAQRAARDLNSICCLLSVEFNSYWSLRTYPRPRESEDLPSLPEWSLGFVNSEFREHIIGVPQEVTIPLWLTQAVDYIDANATLNSALHSHRQGLALMKESPSHSLVCFIGAVESVGATLEQLEQCPKCQSYPGARRRFRKALRTALSDREVKALRTVEVYDLRSQTVHAGTLHGEEMNMGNVYHPMETFAPRPDSIDFRYNTLWKMRDASRRVLIKQFLRHEASMSDTL